MVRAAVNLFAIQPPDSISVSDIVAEVGMTPAAFYYHFPSKEHLAAEIVSSFAGEWVAEVTTRLDMAHEPEDFPALISSMIEWLGHCEQAAKIYFVTSVATSDLVEEIRQASRNDLYTSAITAHRRVWPKARKAQIGMAGVALVILLEVTSRARVQVDESYIALGPVRFRQAAARLARGLSLTP